MTGDERVPSGKHLPVMLVVGGVAGVFMVVGGLSVHSRAGTWLACFVIVGWLVTAGVILFGRRRLNKPHAQLWMERPTGHRLQPSMPARGGPSRWVGGCNLPASIGRVNASYPLAVLDIAAGAATLRLRPRLMARLFGAQPVLTFNPSYDLTAFPVRGLFGTKGIGFQRTSKPAAYFWTKDQSGILSALAADGFRVSWHQVKARQ